MQIIRYPSKEDWAGITERPAIENGMLRKQVGKIIADVKKNLNAKSVLGDNISPMRFVNKQFKADNPDQSIFQCCDTIISQQNQGLYEYEIDGVIVSDDKIYNRTQQNPEHAFAFKMVLSEQMAEAKVVDIIWNASKDGYLKPRVRIEPVKIGGVTIEYTTGFNANYIETNRIGIGAVIQLIRSGDVIPYIKLYLLYFYNIIPSPQSQLMI